MRHPVLRLSFGSGHFLRHDDLRAEVSDRLRDMEDAAEVAPRHAAASARLRHVIEALHERTGQPVAVLVDEYDKPILDALEEPGVARANRNFLRGLYATIKDCDAHIRFSFITGVSKFSKVSLFSGLNNLKDITLNPHYSAVCGYTDEDLDTVFAPELGGLDREQVRDWYNGYSWRGEEKVYNPFDILLLRQSLNRSLLNRMTGDASRRAAHSARLYDLLLANDFAGLRRLFESFFASIPHQWYTNNDIASYEGFYASVFYSYFAGLGLDVTVEDSSSRGRLDMAVRFNANVYLFELKVVELAPEGAAMAQLKAKGYADKYRDRGEPIHLIGVEFSKEARNLATFDVQRA